MEAAIRDPGRVAPLERSRLLDGAAAASLDPVARISRRLLGSSAAIACLIAPDRQVVIGRDGFAGSVRSLRRRPLTRALSELVVRSGGPLLVADARRDTPALARREPDVIGYAGVPLHDGDGHILGALCATSSEPRAWSAVDLELLSDVASLAISEISRVTVAAAAERCLRAQDQAEAIASVGSWQWDRDGNRLVCSTELRRLLALARNPATLTELEALMPADRRADLLAAVRAALRPDGRPVAGPDLARLRVGRFGRRPRARARNAPGRDRVVRARAAAARVGLGCAGRRRAARPRRRRARTLA
jgi:PAS domain-containing protein